MESTEHGLLSQKPIIEPIHVWYPFKQLSVLFGGDTLSCACSNADKEYSIVKTCTFCILEKQTFSWNRLVDHHLVKSLYK